MKKLMRVTYLILAIGLLTNLFTSCKKDLDLPAPETTTTQPTERTSTTTSNTQTTDTTEVDDEEIDWSDCFAFDYPLTVIFPDAITLAVYTDQELINALDSWYDENPNSSEDPTLDYPVNVLLQNDGPTVAITTDEELEALFEECFEPHYTDCFTIHFPISIQFPDGTTVEIESIEEGEAAVEDWGDANPTNQEEPELVFPIQVTHADGTEETVNDEERFEEIFEDCWEEIGGCIISKNKTSAF